MKSDGTPAFLRGSRGDLRPIFWLALTGLAMQGSALAVTSQSFRVGATITPGCSVTSGTGGVLGTLNFGTRSGVESGRVSTSFVPNSSFLLSCTPGVALTMSINGGLNYTSVRNMRRNGDTQVVPYRLYSSSTLAPNTEIAQNQSVSVTYNNSNNIALSLFGEAQLTGFSPAGTYSDQLTVTLTW